MTVCVLIAFAAYIAVAVAVSVFNSELEINGQSVEPGPLLRVLVGLAWPLLMIVLLVFVALAVIL